MANLQLESETRQSIESRVVHVGDQPITFDRFLDMADGRFLELIDGVVVELPMIQLNHERCSRWLYQVAGTFVERFDLGEMLSSRIMVKIDRFGGRMPDLLFVRKERLEILQPKAVYGPPDIVIEIVSPGDRPSDLRALEADYFSLGVPELVFVHLAESKIRFMRHGEDSYAETVITDGPLHFSSIPEMTLQAEWVLKEPRPDVFDVLTKLCST